MTFDGRRPLMEDYHFLSVIGLLRQRRHVAIFHISFESLDEGCREVRDKLMGNCSSNIFFTKNAKSAKLVTNVMLQNIFDSDFQIEFQSK